tara:strand:- start:1006 stop:1164 length:159 start_codon:yes stop_codon:yes gene_type:complete
MASAHVIPLQFTASGFAEPLGGTSFGFHFWHCLPSFYPLNHLDIRVFLAKEG